MKDLLTLYILVHKKWFFFYILEGLPAYDNV